MDPAAVPAHERVTADAWLAAIVASSDDAIYSKTLDGILTSWNGGAERLYGYTVSEAVGRHISVLVPADRKGEELDLLEAIRRGRSLDHYETRRVTKTGDLVDVSVTLSPIRDATGEVVGASVVARDITDRKRLEELRARFIANAAHELRTPLTTVYALSSALATRWESMDPKRRAEVLDALVRQGERARVLINHLLELSQLENGRLALEIRSVDVHDVTQHVIEVTPPPTGKEVAVDVPEGLLARADAVRLQQVIANLLTNSFRYGGMRVRVDAHANADGIVLSVSDDGPGIPDDLVPTLFEAFTRGNSSDAQGSGLGLAICKALTEAFGGSISYEPNDPTGARFNISLSRAA